MKQRTIRHAFEKRGIWPINPSLVVDPLIASLPETPDILDFPTYNVTCKRVAHYKPPTLKVGIATVRGSGAPAGGSAIGPWLGPARHTTVFISQQYQQQSHESVVFPLRVPQRTPRLQSLTVVQFRESIVTQNRLDQYTQETPCGLHSQIFSADHLLNGRIKLRSAQTAGLRYIVKLSPHFDGTW